MSAFRSFHGKLLLFGEYTVVVGAPALVIPFTEAYGQWAFANQMDDQARAAHSNQALGHYLAWLRQSKESHIVDIARLTNDIEDGLVFDSNIPNGYGVGSSGALVAALLDHYRLLPVPDDLSELRSLLGRLENYFHGSSSGLDPLACFVGKPLLINDKEVNVLSQCPAPEGIRLRLLDTGIVSPTGPLVEYFAEQLKTYPFFRKIDQQLIPATEQAINSWMTSKKELLWEALREISLFQLAHFQPMIPESIRPMWKQGLNDGNLCIKLCGSGGGGYVMVFEKAPGWYSD